MATVVMGTRVWSEEEGHYLIIPELELSWLGHYMKDNEGSDPLSYIY